MKRPSIRTSRVITIRLAPVVLWATACGASAEGSALDRCVRQAVEDTTSSRTDAQPELARCISNHVRQPSIELWAEELSLDDQIYRAGDLAYLQELESCLSARDYAVAYETDDRSPALTFVDPFGNSVAPTDDVVESCMSSAELAEREFLLRATTSDER